MCPEKLGLQSKSKQTKYVRVARRSNERPPTKQGRELQEITGRIELLVNRNANIVSVIVIVTLSFSIQSDSQNVVIGVIVMRNEGIINCRTKYAARRSRRMYTINSLYWSELAEVSFRVIWG